jgi:uncharacterized membrane protein YgdD (TMEM256/DUF423 family)
MSRTFIVAGAVGGFLSVAFGAFGAHALKEHLSPEMLQMFETGVRYQMYHSLALFVVAWGADKYISGLFSKAGWLFIVGIVIFSGSLYLLTFTGLRWFGAVTPVGGVAFLAGWACLAVGFWKSVE